MTDNIKTPVQEKSAWAKVPQEFNDWWNSDYSDESNPFRINSAAYWAWAGWSEAVRLNAQAVPDVAEIQRVLECVKTSVQAGIPVTDGWRILESLLSAAPAAPQPAQQPLTDEQMWELWNKQGSDEMTQQEAITFARAIEQAHGIGVKND